MDSFTDTLARRAVDREVGERRAEYAEEIQRILGATYDLIEQTGNVDPSLRDLLKYAGLSTQAFYRFFESKDELLLLLLDDGRRQLIGYLEHQMRKQKTSEGAVGAWIRGVLAQASDPASAHRTRPFLINQDRLAQAYPAQQRATVDLLIDQLAAAMAVGRRTRRGDIRRDAEAVYHMAFGLLHCHIMEGSAPAPAEVEHLVNFVRRATDKTGRS